MANELPTAVSQALASIRAHPAVESVALDMRDGVPVVTAHFRVSLPSRWLAEGKSPNGVQSVEPVVLRLPPDFPLRAPFLELRSDFDRSHPHINPGPADQPPVPCVVEGSLTELLHARGLEGVLNQISAWLDNAANGTLINRDQGWEPVRRDMLSHLIVADVGFLIERADGHERPWFVQCEYWVKNDVVHPSGLIHLGDDTFPLSQDTLGNLIRHDFSQDEIARGQSIALIVGPKKGPDGLLPVCSTYLPESVSTLSELRQRAVAYGCVGALDSGINLVRRRLADARSRDKGDWPLVFPIVLIAARPYRVIGTESSLELIPYLVRCTVHEFLTGGDGTPVDPAGHIHSINPNLLRRVSGITDDRATGPWTLLGAGSLGSHIGIGLGRMGDGPAAIVDDDVYLPHNAGRHALLPGNASGLGLLGSKASALQEALGGLTQPADSLINNALDVLENPKLRDAAAPKDTWALVNATASLSVREALIQAAPTLRTPVIEAAIWSRGAASSLLIESTDGNPGIGDIIATLYERARKDPGLRTALLSTGASHDTIETGQGCRSSTMPMPDSVVAQYASAMCLAISDLRRDGLPTDKGLAWVGLREGIGVHWQQFEVNNSVVINVTGSDWSIRVCADAHHAILIEIGRFPGVETGGVLMGRISEVTHTIYVTSVLAAPEGSEREPGRFVLGAQGLTEKVERYARDSSGTLYCLGTWHSHLEVSGPSAIDVATLELLKDQRVAPSVMLIRHPSGYEAIMSENGRQ